MKKPLYRSKVRIALGRFYYTMKCYWGWYFGGVRFATGRSRETLPHIYFSHKTPLLRKLKNVDMWLQYNKVKNLKLAVRRLNGIVVNPGETFSYWRLLGKPTRWKGYLPGMVLYYGGFRPGIGGGLCQLSNLIYWLTLHTPLVVTERHRHSYDVFPDVDRTQPFGSGATCAFNYLDLRIMNNTAQPFQLQVWLDNEHLHGQWRAVEPPTLCYEVYERQHWISQEYWGGYVRHNIIYRRVLTPQGVEVDDEYGTENHAVMMYQPFLEAGGDRCTT